MIARVGETRQDKYTSGTYDGISINTYMLAAAANNVLAQSDFSPSSVSVKVILKRQNQTHTIMQDNLLTLGTFSTIKKGLHEFVNGVDLVYAASGVKQQKLRVAELKFGGPIRVNPGDELVVEVGVAQTGTFSAANVDTTNSYVEFMANSTIGYEVGIYQTISQVVQATTTKEKFNLGDNIAKIIMLNFDKNNLESQVISNLNLASDKLDLSYNFNQLVAQQLRHYNEMPPSRFGTDLPITTTPTVYRGLDLYPQSLIIFDNCVHGVDLDRTTLDISFNSANVAASQNYCVYQKYEVSLEQLQDAKERISKHQKEKIETVIKSGK